MNGMNPMNIIRMFMGKGGTPQQFAMNLISQNNNNPMFKKLDNPVFKNLIDLANNGNTQEVEKIARNLCEEKGMDFDKDFSDFKKFTSSFMKQNR